jgi:hypothetical protein
MYERRMSHRRTIDLALDFQGVEAKTRNVSSAGVLFEAANGPLVGANIEFTIRLSATSEKLHCKGTVVRVEEVAGVSTVATRLEQVWLETAN